MIVGPNRQQLDIWLQQDAAAVLLVLREVPPSAAARSVHDYIDRTRADGSRAYDADWHEVLVTAAGSAVNAQELALWFTPPGSPPGTPPVHGYAVLKRKTKPVAKDIVWQGSIADLLFPNGEPLYVQIRRAFLR